MIPTAAILARQHFDDYAYESGQFSPVLDWGTRRVTLARPSAGQPFVPRRLSVLMPVFNERETLDLIVDQILSAPVTIELELVAVDDGSSDGSWDVLCRRAEHDPRINLARHERNRGKGAAVRTAIARMRGDVAVIQDADLEYDPADYAALLAPIAAGRADAVFGSRFLGRQPKMSRTRSLANRWLTWLTNRLTGLALSDMETCYKMIRADLLRSLALKSDSFAIEPELVCRLAQAHARIVEIPISYSQRTRAEGKKIRPRDGLEAMWVLARCAIFDRKA